MKVDVPTPECDRMAVTHEQSQAIGEFLEWLPEQGYHLGQWVPPDGEFWPDTERFVPAPVNVNGLLARFFGIDLDKVESEKRAILAALQG